MITREYGSVAAALRNVNIENGFLDRSESVISFDYAFRTFTISPVGDSFQFRSGETIYTKDAPDSIVIPDASGLWIIYYGADGELAATQVFADEIILRFAITAAVYWSVTDQRATLFADERHGSGMSGETHLYLHNTRSARLGRRGAAGIGAMPVNVVADGNGDLEETATVGFTDAVIWDEDIEIDIVDGSPQILQPFAQVPLLYRSGAGGEWRKLPPNGTLVATTGTGRAAWNEFTGASWTLTEVTNNDFVLVHIYATTDVATPLIGFIGQEDYPNLGAARDGAETEIRDLTYGGLATLIPETVAVATFIFQTSDGYDNSVKSRIRTTEGGSDYLDWRLEEISAVAEEV
jgi:hypothetical protein